LSTDPFFLAAAIFAVGDEIEATVIRMDDGEGNIELSKKEANDVLAWDKLQTMLEEETVVKVRIKESVKSGVVAFLEGMRAFIPASQLAADYVEDVDAWVGKEIEVKVITVDREKNKVVLSGKAVAREKEAEERRHRISMMAPGTVLEGVVESLMPYGAFVSLGNGISGLVHISQISQKRIKKPSEVLKEGQKVKVKILNTNDNKVSLSMKALEEVMADEVEDREPQEYTSGENVSTSLGDLLAKLNL
ncbi:MAG: S1 RNA-binding domain-containing protein, partial [Lachnospiraceae bacterium]|nr:S1 RNA-binding domain-containing protein [Lachnospiraceae bacterium]